jgi:hypothetical protein
MKCWTFFPPWHHKRNAMIFFVFCPTKCFSEQNGTMLGAHNRAKKKKKKTVKYLHINLTLQSMSPQPNAHTAKITHS